MNGYDEQYAVEPDLFGAPYPAFVTFVEALGGTGEALDLGCGQGRDALMLAERGYRVTGVDVSRVGIEQMLARAQHSGLAVAGVVSDIFDFIFPTAYDLTVLDSILHFAKDRNREAALLDRAVAHTKPGGHICLFVHQSRAKERCLDWYVASLPSGWETVVDRYIDYMYEQKQSGFHTSFRYRMLALRRNAEPNP